MSLLKALSCSTIWPFSSSCSLFSPSNRMFARYVPASSFWNDW